VFDLYLLLASEDTDTAEQPPAAPVGPSHADTTDDDATDPAFYTVATGDGDTVPVALAA
jgi:hypothetical protein